LIHKILHIKRQKPGKEPYWEDFAYETEDEGATVGSALLTLPVSWEHSCLQKKCGACAMIINGIPGLACDTRLKELKGDVVTVEPLRKFPVVEDLKVDRSIMMENLKKLEVWLRENPDKAGRFYNERVAFNASKCLQCGLCLEVCPGFCKEGNFGGAAAAMPLSRIIEESGGQALKDVSRSYKNGFYEGCGKSLACRDICPLNNSPDDILVRSNAVAVWKRRKELREKDRE